MIQKALLATRLNPFVLTLALLPLLGCTTSSPTATPEESERQHQEYEDAVRHERGQG